MRQDSFVRGMGWLRLVGSIKIWVSFAKETYKRDDILQNRPMIVSILLTVATPLASESSCLGKTIQTPMRQEKETYNFAKQTNNFKEPTNRSHTIGVSNESCARFRRLPGKTIQTPMRQDSFVCRTHSCAGLIRVQDSFVRGV